MGALVYMRRRSVQRVQAADIADHLAPRQFGLSSHNHAP
jgi:hypothetical protein